MGSLRFGHCTIRASLDVERALGSAALRHRLRIRMARKGLVNLLVSLFLLGKYWLSGWRGCVTIWSLHDSRVLGCGESPGQRRSTPQAPNSHGTKRPGSRELPPPPFRSPATRTCHLSFSPSGPFWPARLITRLPMRRRR